MDAYTAPLEQVKAKAEELGMGYTRTYPPASLRRAVAGRLKREARKAQR